MTPPTTTPDQVKDPRRILLLAPSNAAASTFLKDLTGTPAPPPSAETGSLAGSSHVLSLQTTYYAADVHIWIDIINPDGIKGWADAFCEEEAAEVLAAVGGYVVLLNRGKGRAGWDELERVLREVDRVVSVSEGNEWEVVRLGVLLGATAGEDDEGWVEGWEVVDGAATGKNEFGEVVGVERVREALEANEWVGGDGRLEELEELGFGGDVGGGFEIGEEDVEGMTRPIFGKDEGEEEESVEGMEALMLKMQAMRDLGADMPEAERKKFAAKAVRDLMKTL
ncbi:hypothetical protein VC83_05662 [Pseudogymnoascus destructans]|uniref:Increased recombination centers protein 6 n=2 Tax=Pseudogymnoascus destructans TaxID=655981 RepID=L8G2A4_PSED2|nr:uncharacterized protein VC83_05662 [Pseudogymnoascus destructans]ELR06944.1 hypothetical protein GMDG_08178 [Pseudogymnoascus destructans 20631-21]OAF57814.1 hypothetical protein VC83_05662 [Pseudogymnoascus destructans]